MKVCIVGRSNIVGMPLSLLLTKSNASVSSCHSLTPLEDIKSRIAESDIVVACCGDPEFVKS